MRKHPVSKFIGLTVLYAAIIVGIFVIQFKTESIISRNLGALSVTLSQTENEHEQIVMKDQFQVSFNGLTFTGDSSNPAYLAVTLDPENTVPLILESYTELDELSIELDFAGGAALIFAVTDDTPEAELYVYARIPEGYDTLTVLYKMDKSLGIDAEHQTANRLVTESKGSLFALNAATVTPGAVTFSSADVIASYIPFDPTKRFGFDLLADFEGTEEDLYQENIRMLRSRVVSLTNQMLNSSSDTLTEQLAVAYVAEMAANGKWTEAINNIPESFKRGNRRTYVSSPYFDNLANMNRSLVVETEKLAAYTQTAPAEQNLDIFNVSGIVDYILREKKTLAIRQLLGFPGKMETFEPTLAQITGIFHVYTQLNQKDKNLASLLKPVIEPSMEIILNASSIQEDEYVLEGLDELTFAQKITLGQALIELSKSEGETEGLINYADLEAVGRLIFNTTIQKEGFVDLKSLADVYPIIASDNTYYPHTLILGYYGNTPVWAWTCAPSIEYTFEASGTVDINIDFPLGQTHYIIFNGIPNFYSKIEIQRQMFRSDPRFENYNSSGYVYQADSETLFIKSRHKSQIELIRLFCDPASNFSLPDTPVTIY